MIEAKPSSAKEISGETGLNYSSVLHHLKLLEHERIVARKGGRPYLWFTTGAGQLRLEQLIKGSAKV
ncbi:winged helix-turn-helix transcriptional regulator [Candidatus Bathyarchaeota archaeon]|nr:winged helix-turn-helix transcriptional regulator [Candidatus Bathyarchaeota archaeon]